MQHLNRLPGFSAEKSIVKSTEKYSTTSYANYMTSPSRIVPQQDATCCAAQCSGACYCQGGTGHCIPIVEPR